ncbi:hypothetical protein ID866_9641 [Astraeus odoratus]|nr:hypothetical protein ID866_9641 [Astraeus odoratus]
MATTKLPLVIPPRTRHSATVIFLHGLGDTGHGWQDVAEMLSRALPHVKWILPHAPIRRVTVNMGMPMPAWFDIVDLSSEEAPEDEKGMQESAQTINALIRSEIDNGLDSGRIVLGGFSQGGVMTLLAGLTTEYKLGGLIVLSGWLPLRDKIKAMLSPHATSRPVFWGHGADDPLVLLQLANRSVDMLTQNMAIHRLSKEEIGKPGLLFTIYPGVGHSSCPQELRDMAEFLQRVIQEV